MTRRKILLLDTGKEWGGGTNSMFELLKRIDRARFDITCCFYHNYPRGNASDLKNELASIGIPLIVLPQRSQPLWAKLAKEMARGLLVLVPTIRRQVVACIEHIWRVTPNAEKLATLLREDRYDLLYMNNQPSSNAEGYLAASMCKIALVQHCRSKPSLSTDEVAMVNRHAYKVIGVSHDVVNTLVEQGVVRGRCITVCNGIDVAQPLPDGTTMRKHLGIPEGVLVLGSIGSLLTRKGNHYTLEALSQFSQRRPLCDWRFLLIGDGPELSALQRQASELGIAERIVFTGFMPQPLPLLAAMDICVLASSSEGLPRVVLEAMLLSKPVIASDVIGTRELVRNDETGLLFPYTDVDAQAQAITRLCDDPILRQQLAEQGYQQVLKEYTIERYVAGVEAVLEEACPQ